MITKNDDIYFYIFIRNKSRLRREGRRVSQEKTFQEYLIIIVLVQQISQRHVTKILKSL